MDVASHLVSARPRDDEMCKVVEPGHEVEDDRLEVVGGARALLHFLLEGPVDLRPVRPLRLDEPVLRVQEDLAVGFPHAVSVHPRPFAPGVVERQVDDDGWGLEIHQTALDEDLYGDVRLHDP